jgi:adenosylhomocysteine nucleosidase
MADTGTVLVVMALPEEARDQLQAAGANMLFTGIGKVNAAYRLTRRVQELARTGERPLVINFGTAGSRKHAPGTLVACDRFVQRDMDVTGLGFDVGQTPFEDVPSELAFPRVWRDLPHARCSTADRFETLGHGDDVELVDMEAYALAKVCHFEKLRFACAKYVSDGADDGAAQSWAEALDAAATAFASLYSRWAASP